MGEPQRQRLPETPKAHPPPHIHPRAHIWGFAIDLFENIQKHSLFLAAGGIAFYGMLAAFPAIAALVSLYGLYANANDAVVHFAIMRRVMPEQAWTLFNDQLLRIATEDEQTLGFGAIAGLLITLWSAGAGVRALMSWLNVVNRTEERRSLFGFYAVSLGFTVAALLLATFALTLIAAAPLVLRLIRLDSLSELVISLARWPLLLVVIVIVVSALYRYGASRPPPPMRRILPGAAVATALWIGASLLFSLYVSSFSDYNATYGTLGAVVVLLMWFYISAFLVLVGAEINVMLERRGGKIPRHA